MAMKKILGDRNKLVEDTLKGFALAYSEKISLVPNTHMVERKSPKSNGKVRFMIGNGSGHEPAVIGWVGAGMFDLNVPGEIYSAPTAHQIFEGIKRMSEGGPVLLAVQNHEGDVLNAGLAVQKAKNAGIDVESVLFYDDVASAPKGFEEERRGMAGMLFYAKIVGALAEQGASIEACIKMFERCRDATRTFSVAITNCTHPVTGISMFDDLPEDEISLGMGVHGESGGNTLKLPDAAGLAKYMSDILLEDMDILKKGDEILVFVNGAGSTTMMEHFIFFKALTAYLDNLGIKIIGSKLGNYLTTQELSGISLSFMKCDNDMLSLWREPTDATFF